MSEQKASPGARLRDPVGRVFQVLRHMVEQPQGEFGVREIAKCCGMQPSTVHRALASLVDEGLVERLDGDTYKVGLELLRLGNLAQKKVDVRTVARPELHSIVEACNETVLLGLYDPRKRLMVRVDSVQSQHPLRYVFDLFQWTEIHRGASGLAILAHLPAAERAEILRQAENDTNTPWVGKAAAETELAEIRQQGYAITHGRRVPGAVGIAAPIFDHRSRVIGDLIMTVPQQRYTDKLGKQYVDLIVSAARRISRDIGHENSPVADEEFR
jgi:DNA-binding IclR family transcriptional regulator